MRYFILFVFSSLAFLAESSGGQALPYHIEADVSDKASLQRGFGAFMQNCAGCHSTQYQRYNRIGADLDISNADMKANYIYNGSKVTEHVFTSMSSKESKQWFGVEPPDLTLSARVREPSWIYSYLKSFYIDESRPFGVNNTVFPTVAMPHVLERFQGKPIPERDQNGNIMRILSSDGMLSEQEYDQLVFDLTNFLVYAAEPAQLERHRLGTWVLAFLFIFTLLGWFLKREYWKDVQ